MRRLSFWSNNEYEQRRAINEAADEFDRLDANNNFIHRELDGLRRQVGSQRSEIRQLKAALQAVCDLLVDLDLIEEEALGYRIDAAVAEASAAEAAEAAASPVLSPFDGRSPAPAVVPDTAICSRCRRDVPARDISFTDRGPTCETCIRALAAEVGE